MSQVFVINLENDLLSLGITQEKIEVHLITVGCNDHCPKSSNSFIEGLL